MGWVRRISPYLLLLLMVPAFRSNPVVGGGIASVPTKTNTHTILQEQNQTASIDFIEFNDIINLSTS